MAEPRLRPCSLEHWTSALESLSRSPYVGPRPQTSDDEDMLIGRAKVLEAIERKVQDSALLVLDGNSGSGKTSLLQNGLTQQLDEIGFRVFVCRRWPSIPAGADVDQYLLARMQEEVGNRPLPAPMDLEEPGRDGEQSAFFSSRLGELLDGTFKGAAVLVLDQFEELLRQHPADARTLMRWVKNVADMYRFRIIVSLRSDAQHLLDPYLKGFPPYSLDRETIASFTEEKHVEDIIHKRRTDDRLPTIVLTDSVVKAILASWRGSLQPQLLELQALLSSLYLTARSQAGFDPNHPDLNLVVTIDSSTLEKMTAYAPDLLEAGMLASVTLALLHAETAANESKIDRYLVHGAKELVRRATPYLWSGGFKVPAVEHELVEQILGPELRVLGSRGISPSASGRAGQLATEMLDSGDLLNFGADELKRAETVVSSRNDTTAGPLLGRSSDLALIEEVRRAAFAIEWLRTTGIAKRTDDKRLTLVHDGSGVALRQWAQLHRRGIEYETHRLTAARGEHLDFTSEPRSSQIGWPLATAPGARVLPNLNWRDSRITAQFTGVVFLNCDFSGARFDGCRLEGVTFVNCLLDDANFESCDIIGAPAVVPEKRQHGRSQVRIAPSFELQVGGEMSDAFLAYATESATCDLNTTRFFSNLVGSPAVPGGRPSGHIGEVITAPIAHGGVAFVGGRISFLTFHGCGTPPGDDREGAIEFYYASGGGLDIVEPLGGSVILHDCAVRGVSVTRDRQEEVAEVRSGAGHVRFRANDSFLVYVYFSGALQGTAEFGSSVLWGVVNASGAQLDNDGPSLSMTIRECRHQFLVNAHSIVDNSVEDTKAVDPSPYFQQRPGDISVFDAHGPSDLGTQLDFMDFRREPEVREIRQRQAWAKEAADPAPEP